MPHLARSRILTLLRLGDLGRVLRMTRVGTAAADQRHECIHAIKIFRQLYRLEVTTNSSGIGCGERLRGLSWKALVIREYLERLHGS
jgi:hypothetical protein